MSDQPRAAKEPMRVTCRYCGKRPLVLSDSTVRRHRSSDRPWVDCVGSGQFDGQVREDTTDGE